MSKRNSRYVGPEGLVDHVDRLLTFVDKGFGNAWEDHRASTPVDSSILSIPAFEKVVDLLRGQGN